MVLFCIFSGFLRFPAIARKNKAFRKRFWWFLAYMPVINAASWGDAFLGTGFLMIPSEYQFLLGLASPLAREFYTWLLTATARKASGGSANDHIKTIEYTTSHWVESRHAIFLAIILSGIATPATLYCVVGMDFAINIFHGCKIAYNIKKKGHSVEDGTYLITIIIAQSGPFLIF